MKKIFAFFISLSLFSFSVACPCKQMNEGCPDCYKMLEKDGYKDKKLTNPEKNGCEKCAKKDKKEETRE